MSAAAEVHLRACAAGCAATRGGGPPGVARLAATWWARSLSSAGGASGGGASGGARSGGARSGCASSRSGPGPARAVGKMLFRQLFDRESCTYTYLLADEQSKQALLIDPVLELESRDTSLLKELGLELRFAINTHVHADHVTSSGVLKKRWPQCQSVLGRAGNDAALVDVRLEDGAELKMGSISLKALSTPGHTNGCHSYVVNDARMGLMVFTGDAVLIRGCGRTDFQQGDARMLYERVHERIFSLADETLLFPAHDYKGNLMSTVGEEKRFNPRLSKSVEEFVKIMDNLNLAYPAQIDRALPLNLVCGLHELLPHLKDKAEPPVGHASPSVAAPTK